VRHTQKNPQKSPADPVPNPENIFNQRKALQKGASGPGKHKQSYVSLQERFITEHAHVKNIEPSTISEEILSEIQKDPCSISSPLDLSPKKTSPIVHQFPSALSFISQFPIIQAANTLPSTLVMVGPQAPTKMERIIATRYGPLVLPIPLNSMPAEEYQKYMPKFTGIEGVTAEEHLESFYSYVDNLDISEGDVWMRVFVQSLDGEARKWFRELTPRSIAYIEALDDVFLKHWGDKKDLLYYHTKFGNLKRENGESL